MITSRSPVVRAGIRAASPLAVVAGLYLLFAGHNQPGGGFAAGLVFGAIIVLRTVAGLQRSAPATGIIAVGIAIVTATAAAPLLAANTLLDQQVISVAVPLVGKVKTGTALAFDIGVTAIVVGLIIALLDGLGTSELGRSPSTPSPLRPDATADTDGDALATSPNGTTRS